MRDFAMDRIIDLALEEDVGRGDITASLCIPETAQAAASLIAKQSLVVSGMDVFCAVCHRVDASIRIDVAVTPGQRVEAGATMARLEGPARSLLAAERVALNFLQRLCGTATATATLVAAAGDARIRIADTRKTTPGMRSLEKRAVVDGGGYNHRFDLGSGILIKENHIAAVGSVSEAVRRCRDNAPHVLRIEIEVTDQDQLRQAIDAGADIVMLDNMSPEEAAQCAAIAQGRVLLEVSGGIDASTVAAYARAGVDIISVGAITHSAPAADISLLFDSTP